MCESGAKWRVWRRSCHCLCWRPRTAGSTSCTPALTLLVLINRSASLSLCHWPLTECVRPLTHASESIVIKSTPVSGASFSCRCTTSNVTDCLRDPKAVSDVISRASAWKTWAGIWRRIWAYGADFWSRFLARLSPVLVYLLLAYLRLTNTIT